MTSTENAKKVMAELVETFSSEKFPQVAAKAYITAPDIPSASWSFGNRITMLFHGTCDARGYKQWEAVGRHPKKGSKAIYILGPRIVKAKGKDDTEEKRIVGFRCIPVFRYEDTEGEKLQEYVPRKLPPLYELAKYNGITVRYTNTMGGEYGSMTLPGGTDTMTLSTESPDTFLHELIHHYDLRGRNDVTTGQDKVQEIVAQLGACVLARMYGYDSAAYTWNYISAYSGTEDPEKIGRECYAVLERVDSAIHAILEDAKKVSK